MTANTDTSSPFQIPTDGLYQEKEVIDGKVVSNQLVVKPLSDTSSPVESLREQLANIHRSKSHAGVAETAVLNAELAAFKDYIQANMPEKMVEAVEYDDDLRAKGYNQAIDDVAKKLLKGLE